MYKVVLMVMLAMGLDAAVKLKSSGATPEAFVPKGWVLDKTAMGYLNPDKIEDAAMIFRNSTSGALMLVVVTGSKEQGYTLVAQDETLITKDAMPALEIKGRALRIHLYQSMGAMAHINYTFRLREACFELEEYEKESMASSGASERMKVNFAKGYFEKSTRGGAGKPQRQRGKLPKEPLQCMKKIGDGLRFSPKLP